MSELPEGWAETTIGALGKWGSGGTPKSDNKTYYGGTIPWIRSGDLPDGSIIEHEINISEEGLANSSAKWVPEGAVLIAMYGATIGKLGITTYPVTTNQAIAFCVPNDAIEPKFLFHGLRDKKQDFIGLGQGGAQPNISQEILKAVRFPLPPLPEQRRIVAKVDGLTARTARARKELDRIPTLIARYKQRLLALAFSGQLPALNPSADRAEFCAVGDIVDISSGFGFPKDRQGKTKGDYPFAKVSDISRAVAENGGVLGTAINYVDDDDLRTLRAKPIGPGSIVFAKIGEALKLNRRAITTVPLILDNNCMALTPDCSKVLPAYLLRFMQTVDLGPLSVATAVPSVRRGDVASLQILLPSLEEQAEIVRRIESAFGWLDRMAADHAAAARLLPKLDAAILAKAFRGELVPQDPNDEPVRVMLERIKAERAATPKAKRGRKARDTMYPKDLKTMAKKIEDVLAQAGDWVSAQDAFQRCGIGSGATTEDIEQLYAELRKLDKAGKLEAEPVTDEQGRKLHDRLRLKAA